MQENLISEAMGSWAMAGIAATTGPITAPDSVGTIKPIATLPVTYVLDDTSGTEDYLDAGFAFNPNQPNLAGRTCATILTGLNSPQKPINGEQYGGGNSLKGEPSGWEKQNLKSCEISTLTAGSS